MITSVTAAARVFTTAADVIQLLRLVNNRGFFTFTPIHNASLDLYVLGCLPETQQTPTANSNVAGIVPAAELLGILVFFLPRHRWQEIHTKVPISVGHPRPLLILCPNRHGREGALQAKASEHHFVEPAEGRGATHGKPGAKNNGNK